MMRMTEGIKMPHMVIPFCPCVLNGMKNMPAAGPEMKINRQLTYL
jgi:hypothetical protein